MAKCTHCGGENANPVTNDTGWTTCAHCNAHFQADSSTSAPLPTAVPKAKVASTPVARPVNRSAAPTSPVVRPPHLDPPTAAPAANAKAEKKPAQEEPQPKAKAKRAKRGPLFAILLPLMGFFVAGGLVFVIALMWPPPQEEVEPDPEPISPSEIVIPPPKDPVAHKRLKLTRREFRETLTGLENLPDANTGFVWYVSGEAWRKAFGKPHADVVERGDQKLYWHVADGTIEVVILPGEDPLSKRNSEDGSALIVKSVNDYNVKLD
ncbi:MAG: hypothetical protein NXI22_11540 [bacterium]|nr:hypothetical protein [bacterium]